MRQLLIPVAALAFLPLAAFSQPAGWNDPFPAHKIADNVYYVGTKELASFLITTPEGHILMNSNYESSVPIIRKSVEELGFKFSDIKILISGHAHPDHIEGDAMVKELTGAQVVVGTLEVPAVKAMPIPGGKESPIDRTVNEGDTVSLGGVTLTAHVMAGHTKGCLAWTLDLKENGKSYKGLVECSLNGQFLQYVGNTDYPTIADDMAATYKKARTLPAELWVSSHASFYGLAEKYEKVKARGPNDPNPFVDPQGYQAHVAQFEGTFQAALERQRSQPAGAGKGAGKGKGKGKAE